jgi:hypothetical protein
MHIFGAQLQQLKKWSALETFLRIPIRTGRRFKDMERSPVLPSAALEPSLSPGRNEDYSSGVSWAAVFAGAFVTAALSLILLALGTGIGLSAVSPWSNGERSASTISYIAIIWLIVAQIIASAIGGYLAGRLRTKWVNVHTDEVHFRDTAHGFLVWAVSFVLTVGFLASAATSMVGGAAGTAAVSSAAQSDGQGADSNAYFVDMLFRSAQPTSQPVSSSMRSEVGNIFVQALRRTDSSDADKAYLSDQVASQTGLSHAEAEKRVSDVLAQLRQNADAARRAVAHSLYWTFLALLVGAFCASYSATIGGRQRDHVFGS